MLSLSEYINETRNTKTKEGFHSVISKEMANIRSLSKEQNITEVKMKIS